MTSSARASKVGGTSRPSALGALKLMASPYFAGACTGKSAGFSLLTGSTYEVKRPPGSLADFVTGITPAYSPALAWLGSTGPPAPAHPVGRSVEHPGSGIVRSPGGTHGTPARHRCSGKDRRRQK